MLTVAEARVLGCLLEKAQTTPDAYPLTMNSLLAACNQKTNRDPVVEFTEAQVEIKKQLLVQKRNASIEEYVARLHESTPVWTINDDDPPQR